MKKVNTTIEEIISKGYAKHHVASAQGYISRKPNPDGTYGYITKYNGRFGDGYILHEPRYDTSKYHTVTYYIKEVSA